jgi:hypothetical protein
MGNNFIESEAHGWNQHTQHWELANVCGVFENYHPLKYEDLHWDPLGELRRIILFLGEECPNMDKAIADAVDKCLLKNLQKQSKEFYPKGLSRDWKENLSIWDRNKILSICGETMERWNYR